jgi:microcystin-dependent protein
MQDFMGTIQLFAFPFPPKDWAFCNGQLLAISQNQALFSLLGTTYGGDGRTTFALPNLQGRTLIGPPEGGAIGQMAGEEAHTLILTEMAAHTHTLMTDATTVGTSNGNVPSSSTVLGIGVGTGGAQNVYIYNTGTPNNALAPQTIGSSGSSLPHENRMPYLVMNYCILLNGVFPSRS